MSGDTAGNLVNATLYNGLGNIYEIDLNNSLKITYGYYGTGGVNDTTGGYYGQLYEIRTAPASGSALQDTKYTQWDAGGNLIQRQDALQSDSETFTYDFLDRLTSAVGTAGSGTNPDQAYSSNYAYDSLGNIMSMNGNSYTYGSSKPHAVTQAGSNSYAYDANGNMIDWNSQTRNIVWDTENRPVTIGTSIFIYDGNGARVSKTESGVTTTYVNKYYEFTSDGHVTSSYYLGDKLVAVRKDSALDYVHQDSLGSTSVVSDTSGSLVSSMKAMPFGGSRNSTGSMPTTMLFTGQRLDSSGLYYYGARYYDPTIGRFISADTTGQNPSSPQTLNRYSYVLNNPLKYVDPTGHDQIVTDEGDNGNGANWYCIYDGNGNILAIATGQGELQSKSAACAPTTSNVPLTQSGMDSVLGSQISQIEGIETRGISTGFVPLNSTNGVLLQTPSPNLPTFMNDMLPGNASTPQNPSTLGASPYTFENWQSGDVQFNVPGITPDMTYTAVAYTQIFVGGSGTVVFGFVSAVSSVPGVVIGDVQEDVTVPLTFGSYAVFAHGWNHIYGKTFYEGPTP